MPFVQTGDVVSATRRLTRFSQTLNEAGLEVSKSFPKNTILMTIAANIGDVAITDFEVACPDSVVAIIANDKADTNFLFDALGLKKNDLEAVATTNAQANINLQILNPLKIVAPSLPEQHKIAEFLGAVDEKIGQLDKKKALLEDYKKGCMQQLFSRTLRFKDDNGNDFPEWETKRLGDVFEEVDERVGSQALPTYSISAGLGWVSQIEKFGRDISGQQNEKYTALESGEFSYNKGNSKSFRFGCIYPNNTGEKIAVPNVFISFRRKCENTSVGFFAKLFESHYLDRGLRTLISSGARMDGLLNVNKADFFTLTIPYPHSNEQRKIADFLSAIDARIQLVTKELDHARTFKKGLLQQMFV